MVLLQFKKCEICDGSTLPCPTPSLWPSSEWYCEKCHKSYPMAEPTAKAIKQMERERNY